jgi:tetratricopeptide (TPR) repeat protein
VIAALYLVLSLAGDARIDARELVAATDAAIANGNYQEAIRLAQQAFDLHQRAGAIADAAWDLNALGLAQQYLGRYDDALATFRRALALDRQAAAPDGEVQRLNNIGTVCFLQGRYSDALTQYQSALAGLDRVTAVSARARLRRMTLSNLAALNQRLGADERALDLYGQLGSGEAMQPSEEAQLLVNQGALVRRLGDPVKALGLYRRAQQLFADASHRDGEISAWRNIGIVYALDEKDYEHALDAFDHALSLAKMTSSRRGIAQALLYRGEVLRRMNRATDARADLHGALDAATTAGLVEEQWKTRYSLGLLAESEGDAAGARAAFERAIAGIESVRADLKSLALRAEFLADKRDVYDALIALRLREQPAPAADVFALLEQSRARVWRDRLQPDGAAPALARVQRALPAGTVLLEYWFGPQAMAVMAITRDAVAVTHNALDADDERAIQLLADAVAARNSDWKPASVAAGRRILGGLPRLDGIAHAVVVADGPLQFVPFETLTLPDAGSLFVERFDVVYMPSAAFLLLGPPAPRDRLWPWQREMIAFANPRLPASLPLETRQPQNLPYAENEVRNVARVLRGRAELHVGADAQKRFVTDGRLRSVPIVHFSSHAVADTRDADRSRLVLAPDTPDGPADYLFLREVADLDLSGVQLATLSACDTERGRIVRGEGVESFSRALLAAGAAASITTMWDVADRPSADLMTRFYTAARDGVPLAAALRDSKLQFLRGQTAWSHPYFWAGYLLTGDGQRPLPRVVPWSAVVGAAFVLAVLVTAALRAAAWGRSSPRLRRTAAQSRQSAPTP